MCLTVDLVSFSQSGSASISFVDEARSSTKMEDHVRYNGFTWIVPAMSTPSSSTRSAFMTSRVVFDWTPRTDTSIHRRLARASRSFFISLLVEDLRFTETCVFYRGRHLSYQRGKRNTNPNTSLIKIGKTDPPQDHSETWFICWENETLTTTFPIQRVSRTPPTPPSTTASASLSSTAPRRRSAAPRSASSGAR